MAERAGAGVLPVGQRQSGKAVAPFKPRAAEGVVMKNGLRDLAAVWARLSGQKKMTIPLTRCSGSHSRSGGVGAKPGR